MAWATIERSCGHEERHQLYGPNSDRESKRRWLEGGVCAECYQLEMEQKRAAELVVAKEISEECAMPDLTGSEKQIAWATRIRADWLKSIPEGSGSVLASVLRSDRELYDQGKELIKEKFGALGQSPAGVIRGQELQSDPQPKPGLQTIIHESTPALKSMVYEWTASKTIASWWIDNRDGLKEKCGADLCKRAWALLRSAISGEDAAAADAARESQLAAEREEQIRRQAETRRIEEEARKEATLSPEKPVSPLIAEFTITNEIRVRFPEVNDRFNRIVRDLDYSWDGKAWVRTGTNLPDRAIETAHRLLTAGFIVMVFDPDFRARILTGDFKPENKRIVRAPTAKDDHQLLGFFTIQFPRNDALYNAVRRLPGAKWNKLKIRWEVPGEAYEEVLDFAERHGFDVKSHARALAEKKSEAAAALLPAAPAPVPEPPAPSTARPILEPPAEVTIPESLLDDEPVDEALPCAS